MDYSQIQNIAFILRVKVSDQGIYFLPSIKKQQGKDYNYIVVCDGEYSGLYKWDPSLTKSLQTGNNKGTVCWVLTLDQVKKIGTLEDLDPKTSIGRYILHIAKKVQNGK